MHRVGFAEPAVRISPISHLIAITLLSGMVFASAGCGSSSVSSSTAGSQFSSFPPATVPLTRLSSDTFNNSSSQHATEVEPAGFAFGQTLMSTFQVGRIYGGGAADIGFAISRDGGITWQNGLLPGLTIFQGGGASSAVSDSSVVYDAAHGAWLISSLTIASVLQVVVSRSIDGGASWSSPVVAAQGPNLDKDWIACDNTNTSAHYGNCYLEWDDANSGQISMGASADGGLTWKSTPVAGAFGLGGQPLVQPSGTVIVPFYGNAIDIEGFLSVDGGASWSLPLRILPVTAHTVAGGLRSLSLPSAAADAVGTIYVVWEDCRFRSNCASNDLIMSTSADGAHWSAAARIPIDSVTSGGDHFIPGLGIDPGSSGSSAHLGLTYYYYPQAACTSSSCALYVGFISSTDGGSSWTTATPIAGPMSVSWLPSTYAGQMVGDYMATSFAGGKAYGFFALARAKSGSVFDEAIYTTQTGFDVAAAHARNDAAGERRLANELVPPPADHPKTPLRH